MSSSMPFPGIFIGKIDEALAFEDWYVGLGGKGRYKGNTLILENGQTVFPQDIVIEESGVFSAVTRPTKR